jgi:tRNA threonylcarbamoyladenosine biosynthesis protein TsaE
VTAEIREVGAEAGADLHSVVQDAFLHRPALDPPAEALSETPATLAAALDKGGGLLAVMDGRPVGGLVFDDLGDLLALRRFGVVPAAQHHGVAHDLIRASLAHASVTGHEGLTVLAREELPANVGFWLSNGFSEIGRHTPYVEMVRPLPRRHVAPDPEAMRALGAGLAGSLQAGDLLLLSGELGAGKTTFTQGLGAGLSVRGDITSPTFVIARVHPSLVGGPSLVHVDAYRLGGIEELDDLDLDTSLDEAVTVVEWGEGIAEPLAEERLEIRLHRATGADVGDETRTVEMVPVGARWLGVPL